MTDLTSREAVIKKLIEQPAKVCIDKTDYQRGYIHGVNQMVKELRAERQKPIECEDAISKEKEPCDECIFEEGSKYCIEHCPHEAKVDQDRPIGHWISVEEELPKDTKYAQRRNGMICYTDKEINNGRLVLKELSDSYGNINEKCRICGSKENLYDAVYHLSEYMDAGYGVHCINCARSIFKI